MHHAVNCISSTQIQVGMYMSVNMLYQTVQILVIFFYSFVQQITQIVVAKLKFPFSFTLGMKRLISHVRLLFNIQHVYNIKHLFSNTFQSARYNMIIHVKVFLVLQFNTLIQLITQKVADKLKFLLRSR